jgi:hypothetical protein
MVYIYQEVLFNPKEEWKHATYGKWTEIEIILFREMSQTKKDKYHAFSHTWNLNLKKKKSDMSVRWGRLKGNVGSKGKSRELYGDEHDGGTYYTSLK